MKRTPHLLQNGWRMRAAFAGFGLLAMTACASTPPAPTEAMQAAELAIGNAEKRRVADYASLEPVEARENLTAALVAQARLLEAQRKTLSEQRETARVESRTREADRARIDAALAQRQASSARAEAEIALTQTHIARTETKGEGSPVSSKDSAIGRQQNRQVEVSIPNAQAVALK